MNIPIKITFLLVSCTFLICGVESEAQNFSKPLVINYSNRDYQGGHQNWSVGVDSSKTVYVGNNDGLLEFDGSNWNLHKMPDQLVVRSVDIGSNGQIYVGAYEEFGYWSRDQFGELHYTSLSDSLDLSYFHNDEIWRIVTHEEKIYFQSFSSLYIYNGEEIKIVKPDFTMVLLQKARNRLFVHGVHRGLYEIIDDKFEFIEGTEMLSMDEIKVVLPFQGNKFLIGAASSGMYIYDGGSLHPWNIPLNNQIKSSEINNGLRVDDHYVIGTIVDGVYIFDAEGSLKVRLTADSQLQNNTVLSLSKDDRGQFWAALDRGIDFIKLDSELDFYRGGNLQIGPVYAGIDLEKDLLLGTNRGLYKFTFTPIEGFKDPESITGMQGQVWGLFRYQNEILCGHTNGTYSIRNGRAERISEINGGYHIRQLTHNNQQYLLQSTYSALVVYEWLNGGWNFSHTVTGLLEPISHFEMDHLDNIWGVHATKGLFKIRLNYKLDSVTDVKLYKTDELLESERRLSVNKINGRIIFTTELELFTYDDINDRIVRYDQLNNDLGSYKMASRIIPIRNNHFWFIINNRIAWIEISENFNRVHFEYDLSNQGAFLNTKLPKIEVLPDARHMICLDDGFAIFNESYLNKPVDSSKIEIRSVSISGINDNYKLPLEVNKPANLPYSDSNITFIYSSKGRSVLPKYRYRLLGLNDKWSEWTSTAAHEFTRLPAGEYTFQVQARNARNQKSKVAVYPFVVSPPWYASDSAYYIYTALFISFLITLRLLFLRRLKKHKAVLENKEKERRMKENMLAEQRYMKLKNEKLESEIKHHNVKLANYTMTVIKKNEQLIGIKNEIERQKQDLGERYPHKFYRKLVNLIDTNISSEEDWKIFEAYFDEANQNFFKRLRTQYPNLTHNDLRLCAYLRMNLSSKEIAPLLNISVRGVEIKRYRLRKRLDLEPDTNLVEFLITY